MFYREIKKRKFWLLSFVEVPGAEPVPITEPGAEPVPITELLSLTETKDNNQAYYIHQRLLQAQVDDNEFHITSNTFFIFIFLTSFMFQCSA